MQLSLVERVDKISKLLQRLEHVGHRRWILIPLVIAILFLNKAFDLLFRHFRDVTAPVGLFAFVSLRVDPLEYDAPNSIAARKERAQPCGDVAVPISAVPAE